MTKLRWPGDDPWHEIGFANLSSAEAEWAIAHLSARGLHAEEALFYRHVDGRAGIEHGQGIVEIRPTRHTGRVRL